MIAPAAVGIGFREPHAAAFRESRPPVGWLEVHPENYFGAGARLEKIARDYPLSFHGVGLSLGSAEAPAEAHLAPLAELIARFEPALVSEHVAWSSVDGAYFHDLLPLPSTRECLEHLIAQVTRAQDRLGRRLLLENPSRYLELGPDELGEAEFLNELAARSGCGLLLDLNNLYVNERNLGGSAGETLRAIDPRHVGELHLAGHERDGARAIDSHSAPVAPEVWALYDEFLALHGPRPTLIEWDRELPPLDTLLAEARSAEERIRARAAVAAHAS